jgi:multiple sugar transport system permease protein
MNVVIAASVIAAIPTVVIFLLFQRNIMSGLTTGSLKG